MAVHLHLYVLGDGLAPEDEADFRSDRFILRHFGLLDSLEHRDLGEMGVGGSWMEAVHWMCYRAPILDHVVTEAIVAEITWDADLTQEIRQFLNAHLGERVYAAWI